MIREPRLALTLTTLAPAVLRKPELHLSSLPSTRKGSLVGAAGAGGARNEYSIQIKNHHQHQLDKGTTKD